MAEEDRTAPDLRHSGIARAQGDGSEDEFVPLNSEQAVSSDEQRSGVTTPVQEQNGESLPADAVREVQPAPCPQDSAIVHVEGSSSEKQQDEESVREEFVTDSLPIKPAESFCACYDQRQQAQERAANAIRQAEGLRVQLAQSQAHAKQLDDAWQHRVRELEADNLEQVTKLMAQVDSLRAQLADVREQCEKVKCYNEELEPKMTSTQRSTSEAHQTTPNRCREQCDDLRKLLTEERLRSVQLTAEAGRQQQKIDILETQLEEKLKELRKKDEMLNVFGKDALERIAGLVGPTGQADLLRLVAVLQGCSWKPEDVQIFIHAGESGKCDSGYQGSIAGAGSSAEKIPAVARKAAEENVSVDEVKHDIRRDLEKVRKLLRSRDALRSLLQDLNHSGGPNSKQRMQSTGFVSASTELGSRVVRKVKQVSSTPRGAAETLSDVSSIRQEVADDTPQFRGLRDETKDTSGSVFVEDSVKKRHPRSIVHRELADVALSSRASSSETKDTLAGVSPLVSSHKQNQKTNRAERSGGRLPSLSGSTQYSRNSLKGSSNKTLESSWAGQSRHSRTKIDASTVSGGCRNKARRSLDFNQQDAVEDTMPFLFSCNSSAHSTNTAELLLTVSTPLHIAISSMPSASAANSAT